MGVINDTLSFAAVESGRTTGRKVPQAVRGLVVSMVIGAQGGPDRNDRSFYLGMLLGARISQCLAGAAAGPQLPSALAYFEAVAAERYLLKRYADDNCDGEAAQ